MFEQLCGLDIRILCKRVIGRHNHDQLIDPDGFTLQDFVGCFGQGDYGTTVDRLLNLRPIAHRFGGSHAQRDVLSQTLIEAALRGGQFRLAKALANERTVWKPSNPLGWKFETRATAGLVQTSSGRAA